MDEQDWLSSACIACGIRRLRQGDSTSTSEDLNHRPQKMQKMFYEQCCLQCCLQVLPSQWRWWSMCKATLLDSILQGEKESMLKKPHILCSFAVGSWDFVQPKQWFLEILGQEAKGQFGCSRMHFWEKRGGEFSSLSIRFLKNPSRPRKNLTVGGKSEDFCTEHAAASQMMGSAGTKFSGEQTSWELWGSLSHPGTSQTEVQEDVFSWLFGYVCWTRMDLTHLPQGLVTQGL